MIMNVSIRTMFRHGIATDHAILNLMLPSEFLRS